MQKSCEYRHNARSFRCIVSLVALLAAISAAQGFAQDATPRAPQDRPQGALVDEVTAGGPAARAGIAAHDIITKIEGTDLRSVNQIIETLLHHKPGDTITLTVVKASSGVSSKVTLTLGANPRDPAVPYMGLFVTSYVPIVPEPVPTPPGSRPSPGI